MTKLLLHLPPALIAEVDAYTQRKGISSRAEAVRALLRLGIDSEKPTLRGMLSAEEKAVLAIAERLRQRCGDTDKLKTMERLYVSTVAEVEGTDEDDHLYSPQPPTPPAPTPEPEPAPPPPGTEKKGVVATMKSMVTRKK